MNDRDDSTRNLTLAQKALRDLWEEHIWGEFTSPSTEDTLATIVADAYVNHVPVLTGGVGRQELRELISKHFIQQMLPDTEMTPISRTMMAPLLVFQAAQKLLTPLR